MASFRSFGDKQTSKSPETFRHPIEMFISFARQAGHVQRPDRHLQLQEGHCNPNQSFSVIRLGQYHPRSCLPCFCWLLHENEAKLLTKSSPKRGKHDRLPSWFSGWSILKDQYPQIHMSKDCYAYDESTFASTRPILCRLHVAFWNSFN